MTAVQSILLSLSLGLLIVGAHQTFTVGFFESYWLFMLSLILLFFYSWLKKGNKEDDKEEKKPTKKRSKKK